MSVLIEEPENDRQNREPGADKHRSGKAEILTEKPAEQRRQNARSAHRKRLAQAVSGRFEFRLDIPVEEDRRSLNGKVYCRSGKESRQKYAAGGFEKSDHNAAKG